MKKIKVSTYLKKTDHNEILLYEYNNFEIVATKREKVWLYYDIESNQFIDDKLFIEQLSDKRIGCEYSQGLPTLQLI